MNDVVSTAYAQQLGDNLWLLDTGFQGIPEEVASYLLTGKYGPALIDVGPASTVETLLASIQLAGCDPRAIQHLVVTHIHLDHAGALGHLSQLCPYATVYVHRIGAPHVVDPTKLIRSARAVYEDRLESLWGLPLPVPSERVKVVDDGDMLRLGEDDVRVIYTPGHARHHVSYYLFGRRSVFMGDIGGVRRNALSSLYPRTPPPDFDLDAWTVSLEGIAKLRPVEIYLPHFGVFRDVSAHLARLQHRLLAWRQIVAEGVGQGMDNDYLIQRLEADVLPALRGDAADEMKVERAELASLFLGLSVEGYVRSYQKQESVVHQ